MMNKSNLITAAAISLFMISTPACSEGDHHHGEGDHHQKSHDGHHGHDDHEGYDDGHHAGKAGSYESVTAALTALKSALSETDSAVKTDKLETIHEIFPRIESSAAYLHDNAGPKSDELAKRLHGAIDKLMDLVAQTHDASHGMDKASASRMLKKLNGSVQLVEAYISTTAKPSDSERNSDHSHGHGSHHH